MLHIGFTGTRHGMTLEQSYRLYHLLCETPTETVLHHGDCEGADSQAHGIALDAAIPSIVHPPADDRLRAYCAEYLELREPKPYHDRNRDIVDETEYLIATPAEREEQDKGGTWYTVRYARANDRSVTIIWPDGTLGD
jgi:hypothetical protein